MSFRSPILTAAFRYSIPVLLGYIAIGIAFGLMMAEAGYPVWLSFAMSAVIYAGAGQYLAVGLFAAGSGLVEMVLLTLVVNARHLAYGFSLLNKVKHLPWYRWYIVFALTDETFALLSTLPEEGSDAVAEKDRGRFMLILSALDHCYWVAGSVIGAVAGTILPFDFKGVGFALTALFIVLMIEQVYARCREGRLRQILPFLVAAAVSILATAFVPSRVSILCALSLSLVAIALLDSNRAGKAGFSC